MSLLHRIEATRGGAFSETAPQALAITRQALGELQSFNLPHAEVEGALEAIAGSLGMIHELAQSAAQQPQLSPQPAPVSPYAGTMLDAPRMPPLPPQPAHYPTAPQSPPQSHQAPRQYAPPPPQSQHAQPQYAPPRRRRIRNRRRTRSRSTRSRRTRSRSNTLSRRLQYPAPPPSQQAQPAHPQQNPYGAPPASSQWQPSQGWQQPAGAPQPQPQHAPQPPHPPAPDWEQKAPAQSRVPAPVGPGAPVRIEAALGAHSPTNFLQGSERQRRDRRRWAVRRDLSDPAHRHAGAPQGGATRRLRVRGHRRGALGSRNARHEPDAPPGFGAQIVQITPEARQLVYRYARNREPLFHDDI